MTYDVKILRGAVKQLEKLGASDYKTIKNKILLLSENPRPKGCLKLKGRSGYRIRQGNFRIIYEIYDDVLVVLVIRIGHRREIYK